MKKLVLMTVFFDKIQKSWNNSTAYMPESGKKGWDLFNAKVHNFIAGINLF